MLLILTLKPPSSYPSYVMAHQNSTRRTYLSPTTEKSKFFTPTKKWRTLRFTDTISNEYFGGNSHLSRTPFHSRVVVQQILENLHSISRNSAYLINALMQTHFWSKGRHSRQTVGGKTDLARVRCQTKGKEFIGPAAQRPAEDDEEYFTGPLMGGGFCPFSRHFRKKLLLC